VGGGQIGEIVKAFAAKVDFQRDLKVGDKFTVVYDGDGRLLYAKIKAKGSYRFARSGGEVLWLDDDGKSLKNGLLRTPVDGARMSSLFGMRRHPILGYAKMHQGIDFAAASGTPIMAAGDGVVVEARRWGGYGNWLRIKHSGGYESGYAHLSRYASGLEVGDKVRQGELVAYVGSTGASTGPHLHHEIWLNGKRVDPKGAKIPTGFALEGRELVAFKAQQARVEAALGRSETKLASGKGKSKVAGLRPAKSSA
jgi:murein DD-endopeptidase MepM/ murein hydrolase activator NlpD